MEITRDTVWAKVSKTRSEWGDKDKPWQVLTRTYPKLYGRGSRGTGYGGDFATRAEALEWVAEKGWVLVKTWDEGYAMTKPLRDADYAESDRTREAQRGKRQVQIDRDWDGNDRKNRVTYFYLSPERAEALIAEFTAAADEYRVVPD